MKLTYSLIFTILFFSIDAFGQSAKKYVLLEHFTNTRCSTCASRNPAFFNLVQENEGNVHHIAVHPPYPYTQCAFYQHNTNDNLSRTEFYEVFGTPRVYVWGSRNSESGKLMSQERLNTFLDQTSPIAVVVNEETEGNTRNVTVDIQTYENLEANDLKLFVSIVEKEVDYNAPNGEKEHFNVFRKSLPDYDGSSFSPAAIGESKSFNFSYELDSEWDASQVYAVAYVQNVATKEIINSGTRFDEVATDIEESILNQILLLYPNPANDFINIESTNPQLNIQGVSIYNNSGALLQSFDGNPSKIDVRTYPTGIYFVKLESSEETIYRKVVVQ